MTFMRQNLLGGMSVRAFLRDYWQKKPLLVRGAFSGFRGLINRAELIAAACREAVQSRLVLRTGSRWELR